MTVSAAPTYAPRSPRHQPRPSSATKPQTQQTPNLRIVARSTQPEVGRAWPLVVLAVLVLALSVLLPLHVNTQMARTSYAIRDARVELAELQAEQSVLEVAVLEASSAQALDQKARELGLVPPGPAGTLSLIDGTISGGEPAP